MIKRIFIILILTSLCLNSIFAQSNINSYDYIKVKINNNLEFGADKWSNDLSIGWFYLNSYFLPQTIENSQYLTSFNSSHTNYNLIKQGDTSYLQFEYDKNTLLDINAISNEFVIESVVTRPKVKVKEVYPVSKSTQEKYSQYLNFGNLIDINDDIKTQASNIAQGEDDVYIVASKVAKWIIEDVNYDLTTATANPNQKSTDVFESKAGVCKEITNLFISMMRSLGIPARVVSGYAYTTSEEVVNYVGSNWGGHAWAEVLIGDTWVPFDLTYDQYGFVDATHIITDKHYELRARSASINASGYGFNLVPYSLKTDNKFEVVDFRENIFDQGFDIKLKGPTELGFDSYGYIQVDVTNTEDFYQLLFLKISAPKEAQILDSNEKMLIFSPNEEKTIYFRYKIPQLTKGFRYTFPFTIYNEYTSQKFEVQVQESFAKIKEIALPQEIVENKTLSNNNLEFNCNYIIDSPLNTILCSVGNHNNYEINNLQLCITNECTKLDLKLNDIQSFTFDTEKYEEELTYYYGKERGTISLKAIKPNLIISGKELVENNLRIYYNIENYQEGLSIDLIYNSTTTKVSDVFDNSSFLLPIDYGNNSIKVELKLKDKIIEEQEFIYSNPKPAKIGFFNKILNWILELITF